MSLAVVGVSHRTAPVEVRERFAYVEEEVPAALGLLRSACGASEAVLLSTCNRTELYLHPIPDPGALETAEHAFAARAGASLGRDVREYLYRHQSADAVRHLYRVAAGLDSLIMGEAEIQGQVRDAYQRASAWDGSPPMTGPVLSRLFQTALSVGGRVRDETPLGEGAASVASVAVELARKIFGALVDRHVLVVGAGTTAEQVIEALGREGARDITVVNRTYERAADLAARMRGRALRLQELADAVRGSDIVLTSTAAPHLVLGPDTFREAFPAGPSRPLLMIDIAIPRDVDPVLGDEPNVFLYNIDDMRRLVDETLEMRQASVAAAEAIVHEQAAGFLDWYAGLEVVPVIRALRGRADQAREAELQRILSRLCLSESDEAAVREFSTRLLNKLLHAPTVRLREGAASGRASELVEALKFLHGLDPHDEAEGADTPSEKGDDE